MRPRRSGCVGDVLHRQSWDGAAVQTRAKDEMSLKCQPITDSVEGTFVNVAFRPALQGFPMQVDLGGAGRKACLGPTQFCPLARSTSVKMFLPFHGNPVCPSDPNGGPSLLGASLFSACHLQRLSRLNKRWQAGSHGAPEKRCDSTGSNPQAQPPQNPAD